MSDQARVTLRIAAPRDLAFSVFTEEIDGWWRRGRRYRMATESTVRLEPGVGGRLLEIVRARGEERVHVTGRIEVWEPPSRLVIAWRATNFLPSDPSTEVEVCFERAIGHSGEGTLVTLTHRGWSKVRPDHPVRHGEAPNVFVSQMGLWWGDLLSSLREHVAARDTSAS